jgi:hypothetical protein
MKKILFPYLYFWGIRKSTLLTLTLFGIFFVAAVAIVLCSLYPDLKIPLFASMGVLLLHAIFVNNMVEHFFTPKKKDERYWEAVILKEGEIVMNHGITHHKGETIVVKKPEMDDSTIIVRVSMETKNVGILFDLILFCDDINHEEIIKKVSEGKPGEYCLNTYLSKKIYDHNKDQKIEEFIYEHESWSDEEILDLINIPMIFSFITDSRISKLKIYANK